MEHLIRWSTFTIVVHILWLFVLHIIPSLILVLPTSLRAGRLLLIMVVRQPLLWIQIQVELVSIDVVPFDEAHDLDIEAVPRFEVLEHLLVHRFEIVMLYQVIL